MRWQKGSLSFERAQERSGDADSRGFQHESGHHWSRFWETLAKVASHVQEEGPRRVAVYSGVSGSEENEDFRRLRSDIAGRRLAGVILTRQIKEDKPELSRLLCTPGLPVAGLLSNDIQIPGFRRVHLDHDSVVERALDRLAAIGRRRVAIIALTNEEAPFWKRVDAALARRGMESPPYWRHIAHAKHPQTLRSVMQLLMHPEQPSRPNALLIADDNLVWDATSGLAEVGVRSPEDLAIIAHCNFPAPTPSALPATRLGFDLTHVLRAALDLIDQQRLGTAPANPVSLSPAFEDELTPAMTTSEDPPAAKRHKTPQK